MLKNPLTNAFVDLTAETQQEILKDTTLNVLRSDAGRAVLRDGLKAEDQQEILEGTIFNVLKSDAGRAAVREAFVGDSIAADLRTVMARFRDEALTEIEKASSAAHRQIEAHVSAKEAIFARRRDELDGRIDSDLKEVVQRAERSFNEHIDRIIAKHRADLEGLIEALIDSRGEFLLTGAIEKFVKRQPLGTIGQTNREIAASHGISIREVKRWRRRERDSPT